MKLTIGYYEVEIEARYTLQDGVMNDEDTVMLLTEMSLWAIDASRYNQAGGWHGIADRYEKAFDDLYKFTSEYRTTRA